MLCGYRFLGGDDEVMFNKLLMSPAAQARTTPGHVCFQCVHAMNIRQAKYEKENYLQPATPVHLPTPSDDTTESLAARGTATATSEEEEGEVEAETAGGPKKKSKLPSVNLVDMFKLDNVEVTIGKTNPHTTAKPKKGVPLDSSKCTRLKGFRKVKEDDLVKDLLLPDLRLFGSKVACIKKAREMSKELVCEAIVDRKAAQDRAIATGEGEIITDDSSLLRINKMRLMNVISVKESKPHLLQLGHKPTNHELTDGFEAGKEQCKHIIDSYNSNNAEFAINHFPTEGFEMDAGKFSPLPKSWLKKVLDEIRTFGVWRRVAMCWTVRRLEG